MKALKVLFIGIGALLAAMIANSSNSPDVNMVP
jgi:hypothetical protein